VFRRLFGVAVLLFLPVSAAAFQGLTGALIGTVKDTQGGVIRGAEIRVASESLIGGALVQRTDEKGHLRFPILPPGTYALDVRLDGFAPYHEDGIAITAGSTLARAIELPAAGMVESVIVNGTGSRMDARDPGFNFDFGQEDLRTIPSRRASMFDGLRNTPGISPTSPSSGTVTTISALGSGTNENQFLIDGTNMTCPCNGIARAEPGIDFIQGVQVQWVGASAEYGNVQGAVINVITRQGSERFAYDGSYYAQPRQLTSQPVHLTFDSGRRESGYERARYRDFTTNLGGPAIPSRLWFFVGYQYLRDYDSQPGTAPEYPKTYEQNKGFAKLTWRLAPNWQLNQSVHEEYWVSPDQPRVDRPIETTTRSAAHVPAITFGDLTHTVSATTVWEARAGLFTYTLDAPPTTGDTTTASHIDAVTNVLSFAPQSFSGLYLRRIVGKGTLTHYQTGLWGADHTWKVGGQIERGEHHTYVVIPTGVRYTDRNGPSSATYNDPSNTGGMFVTLGLFASDQIALGERVTLNAGLRFDRNRAISQDLPRVDLSGHDTSQIVPGLGTLFVWNILSPRLGLTARLDHSGRTMLRASYGRFAQGVLTGELGAFHPGATVTTTKNWVPADGGYTKTALVNDPGSLSLDGALRPPRTDEYGIGVDREIASRLQIAAAYVRKSGASFIGWEEIDPRYSAPTARPLKDGTSIDVYERQKPAADQRFVLTNPSGYSMTYNGLVLAIEKRRAQGWQAFGSYTYSRATGLQAGAATTAAGAQVSTIAPPPAPAGLTFGRDPNDLTNARGRLPNDRPHMLRAMGSVNIPKSGFTVAANFQYFTGKPWAATAVVSLPQNQNQRILIEPRGTRRLSSQALLDLRLSRPITLAPGRRIELLFDVLNALNDAAEESITSDTKVTETVALNQAFGQPNAFVDPRRVMLGIRVNLGKS
jgi:hypothetical protein